jgi:hypothetical protein
MPALLLGEGMPDHLAVGRTQLIGRHVPHARRGGGRTRVA